MPDAKKYGITVTELLNQCTGIMKVDDEGYYAGYYTRKGLQGMMLERGDDPKLVDFYIFSIKECKAEHPTIERTIQHAHTN